MSEWLRGEVTEAGAVAFRVVATREEQGVRVRFEGSLRVDHPYQFLSVFIEALREAKGTAPEAARFDLDFARLRFCNSNGFYAIMDIVEAVYALGSAPVTVHCVAGDDWHRETLPILLDLDDPAISARTSVENVARGG